MGAARHTAVGLVVLGLLQGLWACVPQLAVEGAPCPCPAGKTCCASLGTCLGPGDTCPEAYPASSQTACAQDADCPAGEACQAWRLEDGGEAGPRQCRRACPDPDLACAQGELCQPTLVDDRPLAEVHIAWLCVAEQAPAGCEDLSCRACERVGASYCDPTGQIVLGCFLAVHPTCGLSCSLIQVQRCESGGSHCEATAEGAVCTDSQVDSTVCSMFPCDTCPGQGTGELACEADALVTCAAIDVGPDMCAGSPCSCQQACAPVSLQDCPAGCSEDGGAHCQ